MQAVVVYGRAVARVVLSGLYNEVSPWPATNSSVGSAHCSTTVTVNSTAQGLSPSELHLITASSGFSKSHTPAQLTKKWSFGDDACFIAGHKLADVIGVADGVGGWREYGVDPSQFPKSLMETCGRLVKEGHFVPEEPVGIIARSYTELLDNKAPLVGSCTACIVSLHRQEKKVHTANLGDSGFRVIRCGKVVHRSEEQQHYFNSPYQLSVAPSEYQGLVFSDSPESAQSSSFEVEAGDVILVGTDGLFDNMTDSMILDYISKLEGSDIENVQSIANGIVKEAQKLAFDANYLSPFAKSAASNGLVFKGGKPDDITVMLAKVTERAADVEEPT